MESRPWIQHYDYTVPETIRYPRIPVPMLLNIASTTYPDKPALEFFGTEITFWQLREQVRRMINALAGLGIKKGDRVGLHLPNCPQYAISYYAALSLGAIVVNVNPQYTPDELKHIVDDTEMTALITFDLVLPNIRVVCAYSEIKHVIVTAVTDFIQGWPQSTAQSLDLEKGWKHFSALTENASSTKVPRVEVVPDDPALFQFTGGTTGLPKGAVLTHGNLMAATIQCTVWGSAVSGITPRERRTVLATMPFFHIYGNVVVLNYSVFAQATQILLPRFDIDELLDAIGKHEEITFFPCVPTLIRAIMSHPKAADLNLGKRLGLLNSGAAPMPSELIDEVVDAGIPFSEGWGMTETTSLGIANPVLGLKKPGSIGIPFPDTDLKLVDPGEGKEVVKLGEPGEIVIKSPLIMRGYWNKPEETASCLKDGWLHTGDIAVQDDEGYLSIVDRKKDMILASGYSVYPREIDEVLYQHPKIQDAVAVGVPDEYRGETVKAYVVLRPGESATEEEILGFCREKLAAYKAPKIVEFRPELPKSAVGKILRKILREEEAAKKAT